MAQRFNADDSDHSGSTTACACGRTARFAGRRPKTFITLLGPLTLQRAYYHCDDCRRGSCPRDHALSLQNTSLSPAITRLVGLTAAELSFAKASELFAALAGVEVETPAGRAHRRGLGTRGRRRRARRHRADRTGARAHDVSRVGRHECAGAPGRGRRAPRQAARWLRPRPARSSWPPCGRPKGATPRADPAATPGRSATTPRSRPRPAATPTRSRPPLRNASIARRSDAVSTPHPAGSSSATAPPWIWNLAAEQFPDAIEIVDIYHAKQHLCDAAKAIYGAGTDLADAWAKARQAELDAGRLRALVTALRTQAETTPAARKCIHYVFGNRQRMRYPQFRAGGLCISSGVVEAGCKQIGARLKRAGMRWTVAGANAIIALRCCILSGRFEDFWERRAAKRRLTLISQMMSCTPRRPRGCGATRPFRKPERWIVP